MRGLDRTINRSDAEYTRAPASNVVLFELDPPWAQFVTIPGNHAVAWTCLCSRAVAAQHLPREIDDPL